MRKFWRCHAILIALAILMLCRVAVADQVFAVSPEKSKELEAHARVKAEQGEARAEDQLGWLLALNPAAGAPRDYAEAAKWFRKAADQDYPDAQINLGLLYYKGLGVPKDPVEAYYWLALGRGQQNLLYLVKDKLTPGQLKEVKARVGAKAWDTIRHKLPIAIAFILAFVGFVYVCYRLIRRARAIGAVATATGNAGLRHVGLLMLGSGFCWTVMCLLSHQTGIEAGGLFLWAVGAIAIAAAKPNKEFLAAAMFPALTGLALLGWMWAGDFSDPDRALREEAASSVDVQLKHGGMGWVEIPVPGIPAPAGK